MIYSARPETRSRAERRSPQAGKLSTPREQMAPEQLAGCILRRIESRLCDRVRELSVCWSPDTIVLTGYCSTYYTKQLAQHAAMGVLQYERLINDIEVRPPK